MGYGCLENADDEPELQDGRWIYYDREAAWKGFEKATRCKKLGIFQSIDNIYGYMYMWVHIHVQYMCVYLKSPATDCYTTRRAS